MPKKIYIGIDAGSRPGYKEFTEDLGPDWFTIVGVATSDFTVATKANNEITAKWGPKKGDDLHEHSQEIGELLLKYPLRYFIFAFNKYAVPPFFARHYRDKNFCVLDGPEDLRFSALTKKYTKHGWLTVDTLRDHGYKGETELRVDNELQGKAWEQYLREVKSHAETHLGACDAKIAGMDYPLIRIADIVANHSYNHLKKSKMGPKNEFPQIIEQLQNQSVLMTLNVWEVQAIDAPDFVEDGAVTTQSFTTYGLISGSIFSGQRNFKMKMETTEPAIKDFCPWGD
jgi:hypothetical protein